MQFSLFESGASTTLILLRKVFKRIKFVGGEAKLRNVFSGEKKSLFHFFLIRKFADFKIFSSAVFIFLFFSLFTLKVESLSYPNCVGDCESFSSFSYPLSLHSFDALTHLLFTKMPGMDEKYSVWNWTKQKKRKRKHHLRKRFPSCYGISLWFSSLFRHNHIIADEFHYCCFTI